MASGSFDSAMAEVQDLLLNPPLKQSLHKSIVTTYKIGNHTVRDYGQISATDFMLAGLLDDIHQETGSQFPLCVTSSQGKASEPYVLSTHEAALLKHIQITSRLSTSCSRCVQKENALRLIDDDALTTALEHQFADCASLSDLLTQSLARVSTIDSSTFVSLSVIPGMIFWRSFLSDKSTLDSIFLDSNTQTQSFGNHDTIATLPYLELYLTVLQHSLIIFLTKGDNDTNAIDTMVLRPPIAVSGFNILFRKGN